MLVPLSVRDLMSADVETVGAAATTRAVAERLLVAEAGVVVVVDGDRPVGVVTERDLVGVLARDADPDGTRASTVMTDDVVTVEPDATAEEAALLLASGGFRRLPVVEDGALVGILTSRDLSYALPHRGESGPGREPRPGPGETTAYEEDGWTFEHEGDAPIGVGDVVRFRKTLTAADVAAFAHATGDTNRVHLDDAFAAATRFEERIVHGTLAVGVVSAALARLPGLTIYLGQDIRYLGPVTPGSTVTAVCEVTEALGGDRFQLTTTVYDGDDTAVIEGEATVLVDELPAPAATADGSP